MAKFLVTAGPTIEKIDAVRFISNRSSGKMGYAVAAAALAIGGEVTLISGPTRLTPPAGVNFIAVESAVEMAAAVHQYAAESDYVIMTAAVADYRPVHTHSGKIKKTSGNITIELERTEDILKTLGEHKRPGQKLVGFAAETDDIIEYAKGKLNSKNLDWIIANDVSREDRGFNVDCNAVTMIAATGEIIDCPLDTKANIASKIITAITR